MKCPTCNKVVQAEWNFCPFCQNPLKEKCPECGEMEWINRTVCKTKIEKINSEMFDYTGRFPGSFEQKTLTASIFFLVVSVISGMLSFASDDNYIGVAIFLLSFLVAILILIIGIPITSKMDNRRRKIRKKEFLQKFPEYAEILKKAESADAESFGGQKEKK